MSSLYPRWTFMVLLVASVLSATSFSALAAEKPNPRGEAKAGEELTYPRPGSAAARVEQRLDELDEWLGTGANGKRWRRFLRSEDLRDQLAQAEPDPGVLMRVMRKYRGKEAGLQMRRFMAVHNALSDWTRQLKSRHQGSLAKLAFAARGDHTPITKAELAAARRQARQAAGRLERALGQGTTLEKNWQEYLLWEKLIPHLQEDAKTSRESLTDLAQVVKRFRSNQPGLEMPVFRDVAAEVERLIPIATWAATAEVRDASATYDVYLKRLEKQLDQHLKTPTSETQWKVSKVYALAHALGDSPILVSAVKATLVKQNLFVRASQTLVNRVAQRPVSLQHPVRDCILGTSISGTANTLGQVEFQTVPSSQQIVLQALFTGQTNSRTVGYNKPVRLYGRATTTFSATKELHFSPSAFLVAATHPSAETRSQLHCIRKTGGPLGRRLVERIAWKKAGESKARAEQIAARHAEVQIADGFDQRVLESMSKGRKQYQEKFIPPMKRRDILPADLRMHSGMSWLGVDATFARPGELAAPSSPPPVRLGHDLSVQLHESALGNYLPLALAGVTISQKEKDTPATITGDAPPWLRKATLSKRAKAKVQEKVAETLSLASPLGSDVPDEAENEEADQDKYEFQPWTITLSSDQPVSVSFDQGNLIIRMRASLLVSGEREFKNWDFIITYEITHDQSEVVLKRVGKIDVLPLGFDTVWDKRMSPQKSGFRSTLAENMNRRAENGESFPPEIRIPALKIGSMGAMKIRQLEADGGWLTVGWGL